MRIGIVTIDDYTNYGNRLQNFAVYYVMKNRLHCKVKSLFSTTMNSFNDGNYISWFKEQIMLRLSVFPKLVEKRFGCGALRWCNFYNWSKKIPIKRYYSCSCIPKSLNAKMDYFLVGSDQVWNYDFCSEKFYDYFLKFTESKKKIALSASFGVDTIPEEWKQEYIDGLKDFQYISVREDAGKEIVKELLNKDAQVLVDPVMMLSPAEWTKVSKKPRVDISKPYVLKYYLGDEAEENKIDNWAKEKGYVVYELLNKDIPELYSAGPGEFISLIKNASLVCSDSFHCIVFSIIFSRPFLVYSRLGASNNMNSRLDTLLKKFGFQDRWKDKVAEQDYLNCNFEHVSEILKEEQEKFMNFLKNALKQ